MFHNPNDPNRNHLILGDCLEVLQTIENETVDLIYLDPPFFSNRNYEVIWGDSGEIRSFEDRWSGGIDQYILWLKDRVKEMYRVLKPTGSIFLHCDWHANAYIRVEILDKIFGYNNFRGEIIWKRTNAHNDAKKKIAVLTDSIFYYSKSDKFTYNPAFVPLSQKYTEEAYRHEDEKGKYRLVVLTGPRINPNDQEWRGYQPAKIGRSWSVPKELISQLVEENEISSLTTSEKLEILYQNDLIEFSKNGIPNYKRYLTEDNGLMLGNLWIDIKNLQGRDNERIGYPTQKPEKLLERIILACSNEGDFVLDPFVGGGTTIAVAEKLNRRWLGIDQSVQAVRVTEMRIRRDKNIFSRPFAIKLPKYDRDELRKMDAFEFEKFIIEQFQGVFNTKQRGDFGIDGEKKDGTPIQVKRSDDVGRNIIDNFRSAAERYNEHIFEKNRQEGKPVGFIIAFSFNKGAVQEVARLNNQKNTIIKLVTVDKILPLANPPQLNVSAKSVENTEKGQNVAFEAKGNSEAGVEFYAWDWSYDLENKHFMPDIMRDKTGKQEQVFEHGEHIIAVKVIDGDGLEETEILRLDINGEFQVW